MPLKSPENSARNTYAVRFKSRELEGGRGGEEMEERKKEAYFTLLIIPVRYLIGAIQYPSSRIGTLPRGLRSRGAPYVIARLSDMSSYTLHDA